MLAILAAIAFAIGWVLQVAGSAHAAWLQPAAMALLGLFFLALYLVAPGWQPWKRG